MKHKHRQVSRRRPIQALRKCTWAGWKAGGRDGWESATKAWNGETKRDETVGREERARRRRQRFSCFTMQFLKLVLHIDGSDIHNLWLTFTVCLGWMDWMEENVNAISCVNLCNSNIIFLLCCDLHRFQPLTFLMALFSYSLKRLL